MTDQPTTKKSKTSPQSFADYANEFLSRPEVIERIEAAKNAPREVGLVNLNFALSSNTPPRVRGIMKDVFGLTYPPEMGKEEVIKRSIKHIVSLAEVPEDMEFWAADLGIVHTDDEDSLRKGEVVILRANKGESVQPLEYLIGWILREVEVNGEKKKQFVFCDVISLRHISWGCLVKKRKEPTIHVREKRS